MNSNRTTSLGGRMQRHVAQPWVWATPEVFNKPFAAVCLKGGQTYAGPADALLPFTDSLISGATMMICDRADALRYAVRGSIDG